MDKVISLKAYIMEKQYREHYKMINVAAVNPIGKVKRNHLKLVK